MSKSWPPGYIHRNTFPSSSAWTLPVGVSSPPHLRIRRRLGSLLVSSSGVLPLLLDLDFPLAWYLSCTFRLMPEKWPYISRMYLTCSSLDFFSSITALEEPPL